MSTSHHLAKHIRQVFFGGNWTVSNVKDQLMNVSLEQSLYKVEGLNTIAVLTYHIGYFVHVAKLVLDGGPLEGNDKLSFDHPPLDTDEDWINMVETILTETEHFASLVEELPDDQLWENFVEEKYGNYYRNIQGIIEHTHYHLGQIALVKKLVL